MRGVVWAACLAACAATEAELGTSERIEREATPTTYLGQARAAEDERRYEDAFYLATLSALIEKHPESIELAQWSEAHLDNDVTYSRYEGARMQGWIQGALRWAGTGRRTSWKRTAQPRNPLERFLMRCREDERWLEDHRRRETAFAFLLRFSAVTFEFGGATPAQRPEYGYDEFWQALRDWAK
jgi:hypothetical protein